MLIASCKPHVSSDECNKRIDSTNHHMRKKEARLIHHTKNVVAEHRGEGSVLTLEESHMKYNSNRKKTMQ